MSEPETAVVGRATPAPGGPRQPARSPSPDSDGGLAQLLRTAAGRNLGLVVALLLLLVSVTTLVTNPAVNLASRRVEARADVHALDLTQLHRRCAGARGQHDSIR